MIGGDRIYKNIKGINKLFSINPEFNWNDIKYLEGIEYHIELNDFGEEVSNMKILFVIELSDKSLSKVWIQFNEVNFLKLKNIGGGYNQIMGFEIEDKLNSGWEQEQRYVVRDYENGTIEFSCKIIEVL